MQRPHRRSQIRSRGRSRGWSRTQKFSLNVAFIGFKERRGSRVPYSVGERKENISIPATKRSTERSEAGSGIRRRRRGVRKIFTLSSPHPHPPRFQHPFSLATCHVSVGPRVRELHTSEIWEIGVSPSLREASALAPVHAAQPRCSLTERPTTRFVFLALLVYVVRPPRRRP